MTAICVRDLVHEFEKLDCFPRIADEVLIVRSRKIPRNA
jgi:hypothetical protein